MCDRNEKEEGRAKERKGASGTVAPRMQMLPTPSPHQMLPSTRTMHCIAVDRSRMMMGQKVSSEATRGIHEQVVEGSILWSNLKDRVNSSWVGQYTCMCFQKIISASFIPSLS